MRVCASAMKMSGCWLQARKHLWKKRAHGDQVQAPRMRRPCSLASWRRRTKRLEAHSSWPWRQEGLVLAALQLEARWWREQRQEQRQHGLNGHHGFWILKVTVTGASRRVFCV